MNKGVGVGIGIGIMIIIVGIVFSLLPSEQSNNEVIENISNIESSIDESLESTSEQNVIEEPVSTGTEFSVELTEKIGMKNQ